MFDIGWSEIVLAAVVALVILGPRELPHVLRLLGQWMRKVREMAREFRTVFDLEAEAHQSSIGHHPTEETILTDRRVDEDPQMSPSEKAPHHHKAPQASSLKEGKSGKKSSNS